jgi:hypothetical protein
VARFVLMPSRMKPTALVSSLALSLSLLTPLAAHADPTPTSPVRQLSFEIVERGPGGAEVARMQPRLALREGGHGRVVSDAYALEARIDSSTAAGLPIHVDLSYAPASGTRASLEAGSELALGRPTEIAQIALAGGRRVTLVATVR